MKKGPHRNPHTLPNSLTTNTYALIICQYFSTRQFQIKKSTLSKIWRSENLPAAHTSDLVGDVDSMELMITTLISNN